MAIQINFKEKDFATLLGHGESMLKSNHQQIKEKFPIKSFEYIRQGSLELIAEIRFEKEKTTLTCEFDSTDICLNSYLFPDNLKNIEAYISYLNQKYEYDVVGDRWKLPNSYLTIRRIKDIFCFMFS